MKTLPDGWLYLGPTYDYAWNTESEEAWLYRGLRLYIGPDTEKAAALRAWMTTLVGQEPCIIEESIGGSYEFRVFLHTKNMLSKKQHMDLFKRFAAGVYLVSF